MSTSTHNPAEAVRRRQRRAFKSLLFSIPCVAMSGFFWIPVSYYRDGGPISVIDLVEEIKLQALSYSLLALAGFFFVRGIVIRCRPLPSMKTQK